MSWDDAQENCKLMGGFLAEPQNSEQNEALKSLARINDQLTGPRYYGPWIGTTDKLNENVWFWHTSGKAMSFTDWSPNEPNNHSRGEHCLQLKKNYDFLWNDAKCQLKQPSICQIKL